MRTSFLFCSAAMVILGFFLTLLPFAPWPTLIIGVPLAIGVAIAEGR